MTVKKVKSFRWKQTQGPYWVKLLISPPVEEKHGLRAGEIHRVIQHLECEGRTPGGAIIKVRGQIGELVGLCNNEFEYCNEQGGTP